MFVQISEQISYEKILDFLEAQVFTVTLLLTPFLNLPIS